MNSIIQQHYVQIIAIISDERQGIIVIDKAIALSNITEGHREMKRSWR
jgi:hypothetical protein